MKIFSFKKSTEIISNWFFFILFAVALGAAVIVIVNVANVSVAEASKIPKGIEEELILISRFYYSENCFAYQDGVGRVHTGVIDSDKFEQANMDDKCFKCFPENNVRYAYQLSLEQSPSGSFGTASIKTSNWEEGSYAAKEMAEDVLVFYEGKKHNGKLRIKIQNVE